MSDLRDDLLDGFLDNNGERLRNPKGWIFARRVKEAKEILQAPIKSVDQYERMAAVVLKVVRSLAVLEGGDDE